jgi:hypothetical protein
VFALPLAICSLRPPSLLASILNHFVFATPPPPPSAASSSDSPLKLAEQPPSALWQSLVTCVSTSDSSSTPFRLERRSTSPACARVLWFPIALNLSWIGPRWPWQTKRVWDAESLPAFACCSPWCLLGPRVHCYHSRSGNPPTPMPIMPISQPRPGPCANLFSGLLLPHLPHCSFEHHHLLPTLCFLHS